MSTIRTDNLSNSAGTSTVTMNTVVNGSAKAWVNFNGTGTVAIRAAFNVSSITDNGTGDYRVNFTTAMADANYSVIATSTNYNGGQANNPTVKYGTGSFNGNTTPSLKTTAAVTIVNGIGNGTAYNDSPEFNVAIFR